MDRRYLIQEHGVDVAKAQSPQPPPPDGQGFRATQLQKARAPGLSFRVAPAGGCSSVFLASAVALLLG